MSFLIIADHIWNELLRTMVKAQLPEISQLSGETMFVYCHAWCWPLVFSYYITWQWCIHLCCVLWILLRIFWFWFVIFTPTFLMCTDRCPGERRNSVKRMMDAPHFPKYLKRINLSFYRLLEFNPRQCKGSLCHLWNNVLEALPHLLLVI